MGSLFKKNIDKKVAINTLIKTFMENNYFIKYDDPRLEILNQNYDSEILDIKLESSKSGFMFLIIYWTSKNNTKENKYSFRIFINDVKAKFNHILTCDLNELNKEDQNNNSSTDVEDIQNGE